MTLSIKYVSPYGHTHLKASINTAAPAFTNLFKKNILRLISRGLFIYMSSLPTYTYQVF